MAAYMQTSTLLKQKNIAGAEHFCNIYLLVDPTNNEAHYFWAEINAIKGNENEAIKALNKAIKLDFKDVKRVENDSAFVTLKNESDYKIIIETLQNVD